MLMQNKKGVILGIANDYSIAYGIAKELFNQGAKLMLSYQNEALKSRVEKIATEFNGAATFKLDVSCKEDMDAARMEVEKQLGNIDFIVHAVGFSNKDELRGLYLNTSRENFINTMLVSVYSFTEIMQKLTPLFNFGSSALTLSYYGAQKVLPHYNVMGVAKAALESSVRYLSQDLGPKNIRVNCISAGPIKTLAAMGIGDFKHILDWNRENAPLKRTVSQQEVGKSALYLLSDLSSGVTGETHFVDAGYNIIGMKFVDYSHLI